MKKRSSCALLAGLLCLMVAIGFAAEREGSQSKKVIDAKKPPKKKLVPGMVSKVEPARYWVLVIGVSTFDDAKIDPVKDAETDAKAVSGAWMAQKGTRVTLLTSSLEGKNLQPRRDSVAKRFRKYVKKAPEDSSICVYYAGRVVARDGKAFLLTQDSRMTNLEKTALDLARMKKLLRSSKAKSRFLILDVCRGDKETLGGALRKTVFSDIEGIGMLASCDTWERSYLRPEGGGLFAHFLAEGLSGAADDGDGAICAAELHCYISEKARAAARSMNVQQTPSFRGDGDAVVMSCRPGGPPAKATPKRGPAFPIAEARKALLSVGKPRADVSKSQIVVPVELFNRAGQVRGANFVVHDRPDMGEVTEVRATGRTKKFSLFFNDKGGQGCEVIILSLAGEVISPGKGPVCELVYKLKSGADTKGVKLKLDEVVLGDSANRQIETEVEHGAMPQ